LANTPKLKKNCCLQSNAIGRPNPSWNPADIEPVHWKPPDIDSCSLIMVQIEYTLEFGVGGTHQTKGGYRGWKPGFEKLLGRSVDSQRPDCEFQTLIVLSQLPLAMFLQFGLHATDVTLHKCEKSAHDSTD